MAKNDKKGTGIKLTKIVSKQDHSQLLKLLLIDFGLNKPKENCLKPELPFCRCGKYDIPSLFFCEKIGRKRFTDILKEKNIDRSVIALMNCSNDRVIMFLVLSWNKTQHFLTLVITRWLILSIRIYHIVVTWKKDFCNLEKTKIYKDLQVPYSCGILFIVFSDTVWDQFVVSRLYSWWLFQGVRILDFSKKLISSATQVSS